MDAPQKVARSLVVARSNSPVLLQACEEVLDQMARLVQMAVIFAWLFAPRSRRNNNGLALVDQRLDQSDMGVVGLVCDDGLRRCVLEQDIGSLEVMGLSWREKKARRITQCINRGMDLGAQAAPAASDCLLFWPPPFAPALCWWARTMVESIIAYSLSAS